MKQDIILIIILALTICSCQKDIIQDPPCENYVSPNSKIYFDPLAIPTPYNDDVTVWRNLQFRSDYLDTNIYNHTWYLGAETLTVAKFWRNFTSESAPKTYTVYHAMRWKPNTLCDPLDDGYDSSSFTFTITNKYNDLNVLGKYRVAFDSLPYDTMEIELYYSKFNFIDSVVKNPMFNPLGSNPYDGDVGISSSVQLVFKGLHLKYWDGIVKPVKLRTNILILSKNFIPLYRDETEILTGPGHISINPQTKSTELKFTFYDYNYSLRGRKL